MAIVFGAACGESSPTSVRERQPSTALRALAATHDHADFAGNDNLDIPLSCVGGALAHFQGHWTGTIDITTAPSGVMNTEIVLQFDPTYFVRVNGVQYFPVNYQVHEHHTDGPTTLIAGTASGVFKSASGDALPLGFHVQLVIDPNGNTVQDFKLTGACP